jgi:hypothetical protein
MLQTVQTSPTTGIPRTANLLGNAHAVVCRTVHDFGLYPFHMRKVQAVYRNEYYTREEFCHYRLNNHDLCTKVFFSQMKFS